MLSFVIDIFYFQTVPGTKHHRVMLTLTFSAMPLFFRHQKDSEGKSISKGENLYSVSCILAASLPRNLQPYKPITEIGFSAMFTFQLQIIPRGKHCQRSIAVMGVVDHLALSHFYFSKLFSADAKFTETLILYFFALKKIV